jgi:hypothetical protein
MRYIRLHATKRETCLPVREGLFSDQTKCIMEDSFRQEMVGKVPTEGFSHGLELTTLDRAAFLNTTWKKSSTDGPITDQRSEWM